MVHQALIETLDRLGDVIALSPQMVGRFYDDLGRLGQREPGAPVGKYYVPERWIGSSTLAVNPDHIPSGGVSTCPRLGNLAMCDLLADPQAGPRLLGEKRFAAHDGTFRVLIKILDAGCPIPFHIHATDAFVRDNPGVYPAEKFGKTEAYYFFDAPKGDQPFTHLGAYPGVDGQALIAAIRRGTDAVLELSPRAEQNVGEGFIVESGLLHRPGTALTLEIQQPSDVYAVFQTQFGKTQIAEADLAPGFSSLEQAVERLIDWPRNLDPSLLEDSRLRPRAVDGFDQPGARCEWIYPPDRSEHFSGMRLTVETSMTLRADDPCVVLVWQGNGTLANISIDGRGGAPGTADEFFVGIEAAKRGIEIVNTGDEPLVAFALFAAAVN